MADFDEVHTNRLTLTRISTRHIVDARRLYSNPQTMATLGGVRTVGQMQSTVKSLVKHWNEHNFGPWIAKEAASGVFVGMGGLRHVVVEDVKEIEIGYALLPRFWGQGFATEIAHAAAQVAFSFLKSPHLVSFTLPTNLGSRRVMEKCGFRFERNFTYNGHAQVLYRLTITEWNATVSERVNGRFQAAEIASHRDGWH